jgi:lipoprotein-releasing system permease protein
MSKFVPLVVRRYLGSRRGFTRVVTVCSVLGILLGVAALIMVLAVMGGFRQELVSRILNVTGHMTLEVADLSLDAATTLSSELPKQVPGVVSATPYVTGQGLISFQGRATGAVIRGIVPDQIPDMVRKNLIAENGQRDVAHFKLQPGEILIGDVLQRQLGVLPGQGLLILSPNGARTIAGFIPKTQVFKVAGIFSVGMVQFDAGLLFAPIGDVQKFAGTGNRVSAVEVKVADPTRVAALKVPVYNLAAKFAPSPLDVNLTTWEDGNKDFFQALQVERVTMFIILSLIVLVAAFNIISGQMMLVGDKLSDIAILRTMGATQRQIRNIFFYNGLLLGALGTFGGTLVGMVGVWNMGHIVDGVKALFGIDLFPGDVYFLSELPSRLDWGDVASVVTMAMILTILASLYPAWRAAKFDPVELLRR